jgi:ribosomal protein S27E
MDEPFAAFPSWFLRITCDRCGKVRMVNEAHPSSGKRTI